MTTQPADPALGDQLVAMLRTIGDRDAAAGQLDNQTLGRYLEPGDTVTLAIQRLGELTAPVVQRPSS